MRHQEFASLLRREEGADRFLPGHGFRDKLGEFIGEQEAQIKDLNENFSKQVEDLQKLYEGT